MYEISQAIEEDFNHLIFNQYNLSMRMLTSATTMTRTSDNDENDDDDADVNEGLGINV
jgi:hypothetical protein